MLSKFENFESLPDGGQINRVKSFKYLGVTVDEKWSWKCHIKTLLRKLGHRLSVFAIKGDIPEHFDPFRSTLSQSHGYSTRNGYLPRMPKPITEWGRRATYFRAINDWASMLKEF